MRIVRLVCLLVFASASASIGSAGEGPAGPQSAVRTAARGAGQPAAERVIRLQVGDNMKFDPASITAAPGEHLRVTITDTGQMPKVAMAHNFVLLKKGVDPKAFVEKSAGSRDTGFIAPAVKDQVVASTSLVGPGETADTTFVAPARGTYTFLCSFPGHFALGMKGTLTVK